MIDLWIHRAEVWLITTVSNFSHETFPRFVIKVVELMNNPISILIGAALVTIISIWFFVIATRENAEVVYPWVAEEERAAKKKQRQKAKERRERSRF